ncbi:beta-1,4-N-acetylgalactosaminyltransferase bre-4 [Onthophagus taurus]|uniref:beta-1,4-N-acetylgalactosaminyltransferase bre-4 n=1 Tax=Onthophagus taurus TaxID=166361 RepID=UPI000C203E9D|nr:beta-1,4-N-acetylgalactosaminyltransferase bre-4 [Onthophagus taurus]XP_022914034.1 beta-1,4-N-acetylgalactosaminyltransferase bre-4 [Onthophagus taurus]XP_022914035.1 beta-1,4-N-acetylgalactosaminyltransferase bre-4 [Onthophagus taurus]
MSGTSFSCSSLTKAVIILVLVLIAFEFIYGTIQTNVYDYSGLILQQQQHENSLDNNSNENNVNDSSKNDFLIETNNLNNFTEFFETRTKFTNNSNLKKPYCNEENLQNSGKVPIVIDKVPKISELERNFYWLTTGGHYAPKDCIQNKSLALIIPFRCRAEHLLIFLNHMHPFLKRQKLDYTIFIIEQDDDGPFNRAMLMNIGFKEALKRRNYDYFIFHDVDLLPEDDRNLYTCPIQPRHMSVAVNTMNYKLPYSRIFGGVSAITREHFEILNGFSNSFWGWGGEDDDMSNRIAYHKLTISRYPVTVARYTMLTHKKDRANPNRYNTLKMGKTKFKTDGLNSLKYQVSNAKQKLLYTWILASLKK